MDTETYDLCDSIYELDKDYLKFYNLELYAYIIRARQIKVLTIDNYSPSANMSFFT